MGIKPRLLRRRRRRELRILSQKDEKTEDDGAEDHHLKTKTMRKALMSTVAEKGVVVAMIDADVIDMRKTEGDDAWSTMRDPHKTGEGARDFRGIMTTCFRYCDERFKWVFNDCLTELAIPIETLLCQPS